MKKLPTVTHYELGGEIGGVFNLAPEVGIDPERLERERREEDARAFAAWEYQKKMQRAFLEVPGYVGGDVPSCEGAVGKIIIEPAKVAEAVKWLKRRFNVNENLELSTDLGLCIEVASRIKKATNRTNGTGAKFSFAKPEQLRFEI